jgi:hypothetical protein
VDDDTFGKFDLWIWSDDEMELVVAVELQPAFEHELDHDAEAVAPPRDRVDDDAHASIIAWSLLFRCRRALVGVFTQSCGERGLLRTQWQPTYMQVAKTQD